MEERIHPTLGMRVRSDGSVFVKGRWPSTSHWTKGLVTGNGYLGVNFQHRIYLVHRLVAEAFIGPLDSQHEVDHIDRNKANNEVSNLRICTHAENMRNTVLADRHGELTGTHKWEDPKADRTAYHRVYRSTPQGALVTRNARLRQDAKHKEFFRKVRLNNGKYRWLPIAAAMVFRKLPIIQRTEDEYLRIKKEGTLAAHSFRKE